MAAGSVTVAVIVMHFDPLEGLAMLLLSSIEDAIGARQAVGKVDGSEEESTPRRDTGHPAASSGGAAGDTDAAPLNLWVTPAGATTASDNESASPAT
jgi:hypothetical protein